MPHKVLIADDNRFIRMLVVAALSSEGYDLIEAVDGEEAIAKARAEEPDLVLLDVVMPGLDGFSVLEALRTEDDPLGCPIVMLTTAASEADLDRGRRAGADGHVIKPFEKDDLRETVRNLLGGESS